MTVKPVVANREKYQVVHKVKVGSMMINSNTSWWGEITIVLKDGRSIYRQGVHDIWEYYRQYGFILTKHRKC